VVAVADGVVTVATSAVTVDKPRGPAFCRPFLCVPGMALMLEVKVRAPCEGMVSQWESVPPGKGSLQPVAIAAMAEVTKLSEPTMQRVMKVIPRASRP
jgi:hypothetical protein